MACTATPMGTNRRRTRSDRVLPQEASRPLSPAALFALAFISALIVITNLYGPAVHSPFVFDDTTLPFRTALREQPLSLWITGQRPVLMFTYWANYTLGGDNPV